ncbi:hypothetical protein VNO77_44350 [Canavalia gladiata]|uniref:Uncharacterized protein n=1 Tax=Canavalia gladiata TaxID=3824 RepID=A0AAN9PQA4_CANGL
MMFWSYPGETNDGSITLGCGAGRVWGKNKEPIIAYGFNPPTSQHILLYIGKYIMVLRDILQERVAQAMVKGQNRVKHSLLNLRTHLSNSRWICFKYSMIMEKYNKAISAVPTPKMGYGLTDELQQASFWVRTVLDKPQAADLALQSHMAKKEAVLVVKNWNDRDMLKRLEWTYNPDVDKKRFNMDDTMSEVSKDDNIKDICDEVDDAYKDDKSFWWELDSDDAVTNGHHLLGYSIQQQLFTLKTRQRNFIGNGEILRHGNFAIILVLHRENPKHCLGLSLSSILLDVQVEDRMCPPIGLGSLF